MSIFTEHKELIIGGVAGLAILWFISHGSSRATQSSYNPAQAAQANAITSQSQAALEVARGNAQAAVMDAQSNLTRSQNEPILAEYLAGTSIADNALQAAGHSEIAALGSATKVTNGFNDQLGKISMSTAHIVSSLAQADEANKTSFGFGYGPISANASF